jgi:hypothetical protein
MVLAERLTRQATTFDRRDFIIIRPNTVIILNYYPDYQLVVGLPNGLRDPNPMYAVELLNVTAPCCGLILRGVSDTLERSE